MADNEPKLGKQATDDYLLEVSRMPAPSDDDCCAMGFCPECIHDMVTLIGGGQICPECGYGTELQYIPPAEREGRSKDVTVDDYITKITNAADSNFALAIVKSMPRKMLHEVADQLHIETEGHGDTWIRNAVVKEART